MLCRNNGEWELYLHKVTYTHQGEEKTKWALPNKGWWEDLAAKYEYIQIIGFEAIQLTDTQLSRFDKIKNMPDDFQNVYIDYVESGAFTAESFPTNHPFRTLLLENENKELKKKSEDQQSAINYLLGV